MVEKRPSPDEVNSFCFYNNLSGTQADGVRRYLKYWYGVVLIAGDAF